MIHCECPLTIKCAGERRGMIERGGELFLAAEINAQPLTESTFNAGDLEISTPRPDILFLANYTKQCMGHVTLLIISNLIRATSSVKVATKGTARSRTRRRKGVGDRRHATRFVDCYRQTECTFPLSVLVIE